MAEHILHAGVKNVSVLCAVANLIDKMAQISLTPSDSAANVVEMCGNNKTKKGKWYSSELNCDDVKEKFLTCFTYACYSKPLFIGASIHYIT